MTNVEGRKPEGAPDRSPQAGEGASGVDGKVAKRFSVQRKMAVVARMLRGEPGAGPRVSVSVLGLFLRGLK